MTGCFFVLRCLNALLPNLRNETIPVKFVAIVKGEGTKETKRKPETKFYFLLTMLDFSHIKSKSS